MLSGQPLQGDWKIWTSNCGRGVSRHMGPHDLPKRIGLVRPVNGGTLEEHGHLQLVSSGRTYAKCRVSDSVRHALQQHMDFGIQMGKCKASTSWSSQTQLTYNAVARRSSSSSGGRITSSIGVESSAGADVCRSRRHGRNRRLRARCPSGGRSQTG